MRIVSIEVLQVELPFRFSFTHAKQKRDKACNIIIKVLTEKGALGYGEAIPREYLTGETIDSIFTDITEFWWDRLMKMEFSFDVPISSQLLPLYKEASKLRKTASYAAIDLAVHEAAAQTRGLTVAQLLGFESTKNNILTAPLGGRSIKSLKRNSWLFRFLGFIDFKVKTGLGNDVEKIRAVRRVIGNDIPLRVDTNQCWSLEESLEIIPQLQKYGVNVIEEPTANLQEMAILNKTLNATIMADEKLCTYEDGLKLLEMQAAGMWNLRLAKNGGYTGVLELMKLAKKNDIKLHLGVLVGETSILSECSFALMGSPDFLYREFGFPKVLLRPDPVLNINHGYFGKDKGLSCYRGLGVKLRYKKMKYDIKRKMTVINGVFIPKKKTDNFIFSQKALFQE